MKPVKPDLLGQPPTAGVEHKASSSASFAASVKQNPSQLPSQKKKKKRGPPKTAWAFGRPKTTVRNASFRRQQATEREQSRLTKHAAPQNTGGWPGLPTFSDLANALSLAPAFRTAQAESPTPAASNGDTIEGGEETVNGASQSSQTSDNLQRPDSDWVAWAGGILFSPEREKKLTKTPKVRHSFEPLLAAQANGTQELFGFPVDNKEEKKVALVRDASRGSQDEILSKSLMEAEQDEPIVRSTDPEIAQTLIRGFVPFVRSVRQSSSHNLSPSASKVDLHVGVGKRPISESPSTLTIASPPVPQLISSQFNKTAASPPLQGLAKPTLYPNFSFQNDSQVHDWSPHQLTPPPVTQLISHPTTEQGVPPITLPMTQPIADLATQPVTELVLPSVTQPVVQPVAELTVQPATQSVLQSIKEPVIQPVAELVVQSVTQPVAHTVAEPVVQPIEESVVPPITESVVQPIEKSVIPPITEPVVQPIEKSVVPPITEPVIQPIEESVVLPLEAPVVPAITETVVPPVEEVVVESVKERVVESVAEPVVQPVPKAVVQPIAKPVAQPIEKPVVQPVGNLVVQPVSQPVVQPITEPVAEPVMQSAVRTVAHPSVTPMMQLNFAQIQESSDKQIGTQPRAFSADSALRLAEPPSTFSRVATEPVAVQCFSNVYTHVPETQGVFKLRSQSASSEKAPILTQKMSPTTQFAQSVSRHCGPSPATHTLHHDAVNQVSNSLERKLPEYSSLKGSKSDLLKLVSLDVPDVPIFATSLDHIDQHKTANVSLDQPIFNFQQNTFLLNQQDDISRSKTVKFLGKFNSSSSESSANKKKKTVSLNQVCKSDSESSSSGSRISLRNIHKGVSAKPEMCGFSVSDSITPSLETPQTPSPVISPSTQHSGTLLREKCSTSSHKGSLITANHLHPGAETVTSTDRRSVPPAVSITTKSTKTQSTAVPIDQIKTSTATSDFCGVKSFSASASSLSDDSVSILSARRLRLKQNTDGSPSWVASSIDSATLHHMPLEPTNPPRYSEHSPVVSQLTSLKERRIVSPRRLTGLPQSPSSSYPLMDSSRPACLMSSFISSQERLTYSHSSSFPSFLSSEGSFVDPSPSLSPPPLPPKPRNVTNDEMKTVPPFEASGGLRPLKSLNFSDSRSKMRGLPSPYGFPPELDKPAYQPPAVLAQSPTSKLLTRANHVQNLIYEGHSPVYQQGATQTSQSPSLDPYPKIASPIQAITAQPPSFQSSQPVEYHPASTHANINPNRPAAGVLPHSPRMIPWNDARDPTDIELRTPWAVAVAPNFTAHQSSPQNEEENDETDSYSDEHINSTVWSLYLDAVRDTPNPKVTSAFSSRPSSCLDSEKHSVSKLVSSVPLNHPMEANDNQALDVILNGLEVAAGKRELWYRSAFPRAKKESDANGPTASHTTLPGNPDWVGTVRTVITERVSTHTLIASVPRELLWLMAIIVRYGEETNWETYFQQVGRIFRARLQLADSAFEEIYQLIGAAQERIKIEVYQTASNLLLDLPKLGTFSPIDKLYCGIANHSVRS